MNLQNQMDGNYYWDPKAGSGYDDIYGAGTPSKSGAPQENKDMNR